MTFVPIETNLVVVFNSITSIMVIHLMKNLWVSMLNGVKRDMIFMSCEKYGRIGLCHNVRPFSDKE